MRYLSTVFIIFSVISGHYPHKLPNNLNATTKQPTKAEKDAIAKFNEQLEQLLQEFDNADKTNIEERSILIKNQLYKPLYNQVLNINRFLGKHKITSKHARYTDTITKLKEYLFRNSLKNTNTNKSKAQNLNKVNYLRRYKDETTTSTVAQQMQQRAHLELMKAPILRPNSFRKNTKSSTNPSSAKPNSYNPIKNWTYSYLDPIFTPKNQKTRRPCDKHPEKTHFHRSLRSDLQNVVKRLQELKNTKEYADLTAYLKNALRMPEASDKVVPPSLSKLNLGKPNLGNPSLSKPSFSYFTPADDDKLQDGKNCSCKKKHKRNNTTIASGKKLIRLT